MNEKIKQRLVGAVVLVSLAVIFIPMLLDGGDRSSMPLYGSNVPEQPDFDFEPLEIPLEPVPPAPERTRVIEEVEAPVIATVEEPKPAAKKETDSARKEESKPKLVTKQVEVKVAKLPEKGEPVGWVVQVGSFSQSANAVALRDKLRSKGFKAFVEKFTDAGKSSYRVRVGPELKRTTAEKHQKALQDKLQLKGIIMGHP